MFSNLDNKTKAYGTLIFFIILAYAFWYFSDNFSLWVSKANPWVALIVAIIINPAYLLLIYWLYNQYGGKGILSGILISLGIDIISLTHSISKSGILPISAEALPLYGYADTTFYKILLPIIGSNTISTFILYVIIPGLLFYLALRIIRNTASFNKIIKEAI